MSFEAVIDIMRFTLAIVNLFQAIRDKANGEDLDALYHMGWAIILSI